MGKQKHVQAQSFKFTDESEGSFQAVFGTLGVIDRDKDVIMPGAIESGTKVRISAYNHASWASALPVGKGTIEEVNNELVVNGQFFRTTEAGRETYETVKALDDLTEWSFGFDVVEQEAGTMDGERVQFLRKLRVHEVSPVLLGAGINTRTTMIKTDYAGNLVELQAVEQLRDPATDKASDEPEDEKNRNGGFQRQIHTAQEMVKDVAKRSQEIKELRVADGRDFGQERKTELRELAAAMKAAADTIEATVADPQPDEQETALLLLKIREQLREETYGD